ncbi:MAG: winged helix-turn-helix domain-containing protein [Pseudomonadota bacterium]
MSHQFGDLQIDTGKSIVRRGKTAVVLRPRAMLLLDLLVTNRDRVVSKQEIIDTIWSGLAVSEGALTSTVREIRKAFEDVAIETSLIRTHYGRGLQFLSPENSHSDGEELTDGTTQPLTKPYPRTVAILPFNCLSTDPEIEHLAYGLVDDTITHIARFRDVRILPHSSSVSVRGLNLPVRDLGSRLGARFVVEGSVRGAKTALKISARMIDAETEALVWSDRFELSEPPWSDDPENIAIEIGGSVVTSAFIYERRLSQHKANDELDAWECYVRGRGLQATFDPVVQEEACALYERAIRLDPQLVDAYAELAYSVSLQHGNAALDDAAAVGATPATDLRLRARDLARQAINLDWRIPFAWVALAYAQFSLGQVDDAISASERALDLNPNLGWAHNTLGLIYVQANRAEEAIVSFERALVVSSQDSYRWVSMAGLSLAMVLLDRHDEAVEWSRKAQTDPRATYLAFVGEVCALGHLGRRQDAEDVIRRAQAADARFGIPLVFRDFPLPDPEARKRIIGGLSKAGL